MTPTVLTCSEHHFRLLLIWFFRWFYDKVNCKVFAQYYFTASWYFLIGCDNIIPVNQYSISLSIELFPLMPCDVQRRFKRISPNSILRHVLHSAPQVLPFFSLVSFSCYPGTVGSFLPCLFYCRICRPISSHKGVPDYLAYSFSYLNFYTSIPKFSVWTFIYPLYIENSYSSYNSP